jgi:RimJ/RimL family protein N-acetyltransferase
LLEGKTVNLRLVEKDDLPLYAEWINNPDFYGEYNPLEQESKMEIEKNYDTAPPEKRKFFIEKKDGTKIGMVNHFPAPENQLEIGFTLIPTERGKGYGTEAVQIIVDYLFLSRSVPRIQAYTDTRNTTSQKLLEKIGFKKEGTTRKAMFIRGQWRDLHLYSILREEWKQPKILTKIAS